MPSPSSFPLLHSTFLHQLSISRYARRLSFSLMCPSYDIAEKRAFDKFLSVYQRHFARSVLFDLIQKLEFVEVDRVKGVVLFHQFSSQGKSVVVDRYFRRPSGELAREVGPAIEVLAGTHYSNSRNFFCYFRGDLDTKDPLKSTDFEPDMLEEYLDTVMAVYRKRSREGAQVEIVSEVLYFRIF